VDVTSGKAAASRSAAKVTLQALRTRSPDEQKVMVPSWAGIVSEQTTSALAKFRAPPGCRVRPIVVLKLNRLIFSLCKMVFARRRDGPRGQAGDDARTSITRHERPSPDRAGLNDRKTERSEPVYLRLRERL
jgi:hypothetical protein